MLNVSALKSLRDNYIYLLKDNETGKIAVIDPGDADVVTQALQELGKPLDAIFITHHHWDHTDGIPRLIEKYSPKVYGAAKDQHRLPPCTQYLTEEDTLTWQGHNFSVIETPGHTTGHICFYNKVYKLLFCGDTLFLGGCGRMFEGTAEQYFNSLQKLKSLPLDTLIYCTHEYTIANYRFIKKQVPECQKTKEYVEKLKKTYRQTGKTIPQLIGDELKYNLFLKAPSAQEFAELRSKKDTD